MRPRLARLGGAEASLRLAAGDKAGGFGMSEVAGAGMRVMTAGLSMEQVQGIGRDVAGFVITTSATRSFCCRAGTALHLCNAPPRFDIGGASNGSKRVVQTCHVPRNVH